MWGAWLTHAVAWCNRDRAFSVLQHWVIAHPTTRKLVSQAAPMHQCHSTTVRKALVAPRCACIVWHMQVSDRSRQQRIVWPLPCAVDRWPTWSTCLLGAVVVGCLHDAASLEATQVLYHVVSHLCGCGRARTERLCERVVWFLLPTLLPLPQPPVRPEHE